MSADIQTPSQPVGTLRIVIIVLALIAVCIALSGLSVFAYLAEFTGNGWAQWVRMIGRAILPFLAVLALVFAIRGDLCRAIMALAAIIIVGFFTDTVPFVITHGLEFASRGFTSLQLFATMIVFPLLAVVAFVLAHRNDRLALATLFVSLPPLASIPGLIALAISVAIYGF